MADGLGAAFLLVVVVGSGIMAERPVGGDVAIALLANAIATGAGLVIATQLLGAGAATLVFAGCMHPRRKT